MESETLGALRFDSELDCYTSKPVRITLLGNVECVIEFPDLEEDADSFPAEFEDAARNFLSLPDGWLKCCSEYLRQHYQDALEEMEEIGEEEDEPLAEDADLLAMVEIDSDIEVTWDSDENDVYVSLSVECDWAFEHGIVITLRQGHVLAKVGDNDGHVTNADAFDREDFADIIYVSRDML